MKKLLSIVLVLIIAISVIPVGGIANVSAAYANSYENTGDQRADIIGVAKTQIGYMEGNNNDTKYGDWYGSPNQPWCAMFISWCARQAEIPTSVLKNSAVAAPDSSYFNIPYYNGNSYFPKSGDLFFTKSFSHVGLVYYIDGAYFYTIEGNSNNSGSSEGIGVFSLRRKISDYYFGVPNYGGIQTHILDSSYGTNFTAYPKSKITATNIFDANHNQISSTAWIGTSDKCTIHEVYTDGCCKVSYPLDSGGTKTVYSKISFFDVSHTCNKGTYMWYEAAHPHYKCYKCSICGETWINKSEPTFIPSCSACLEPHIPGKSAIQNMKPVYLDNQQVVFEWIETSNTTYYNIWLEKKNSQGIWIKYDQLAKVSSGVTKSLPVGEYRCCVQSYNSNYYWEDGSDWLYTESDFFYFSVVSVSEHSCDKGTYMWYEAAHPHYKCYKCSLCGETWINKSEPTFIPSCSACLEPHIPGKSAIQNMKPVYLDNQQVVFEWIETSNTTQYNIWLEKKNSQGIWIKYDQLAKVSSGITKSLPVGEYRCCVQSYNSNYYWVDGSDWLYTESDYHYFSVVSSTCIITFDANDGTGVFASQTKTYGETLTLSKEIPNRKGYEFIAWSTNPTETTETYLPGEEFDIDAATMLYAVWCPNEYFVEYKANGGEGSMSESLHTFDLPSPLSKKTFIREGYVFLGWSEDPDATVATYKDHETVSNLTTINDGVVQLYAVWKKGFYGDVNKDYLINVSDLTLIAKGIDEPDTLSKWEKLVGDVDGDGKLTQKDTTLLMDFSVGTICRFPVEEQDIELVVDSSTLSLQYYVGEKIKTDELLVWLHYPDTKVSYDVSEFCEILLPSTSDIGTKDVVITLGNYIAIYQIEVVEKKPGLLGDVNEDGVVNIKDATAIQKHIADIEFLSEDGCEAADVDASNDISIKDATAIQKHIAGIETGYNIGLRKN